MAMWLIIYEETCFSIANKVAYRLFSVDNHTSNALDIIKLSCKRTSYASKLTQRILAN